MSHLTLTANEAARRMRAGELDPVDYLEEHLARIEQTESRIGAWETLDIEGARAQAARLAALPVAERTGRLFGIPVGVKDVIDVAGLPTRAAFAPYHNSVADTHAGLVEFMYGESAVLLGKTVTAQFAWSQDTPKTRNPFNLEHTPGASTSGSPAAVAMRHVPIGIGTQTTSSLLRPGAYCGVVAFKATHGVVSCHGVVPTAWSSDHPGVMARSVIEAALAMEVIARHDPRDAHSLTSVPSGLVAAVERSGDAPRLGVLSDLVEAANPEVRTAFEQTVERLTTAGAHVEQVKLPWSYDLVLALHWIIHNSEAAAIHAEQFAHHQSDYLPTVRANIEVSQLVPATVLVQAKRWRRRLQDEVRGLFDGFDALIAPTSSDTPPLVETDARINRMGDPSFQILASAFGLPAMSIPTGLGEKGLPHAMQLVGPQLSEPQLVAAAAWCEGTLGTMRYPE